MVGSRGTRTPFGATMGPGRHNRRGGRRQTVGWRPHPYRRPSCDALPPAVAPADLRIVAELLDASVGLPGRRYRTRPPKQADRGAARRARPPNTACPSRPATWPGGGHALIEAGGHRQRRRRLMTGVELVRGRGRELGRHVLVDGRVSHLATCRLRLRARKRRVSTRWRLPVRMYVDPARPVGRPRSTDLAGSAPPEGSPALARGSSRARGGRRALRGLHGPATTRS